MLDNQWLKQRLKEVGWTKKDLAERLQISYLSLMPNRQARNKSLRNSRILEYAIKYLLQ